VEDSNNGVLNEKELKEGRVRRGKEEENEVER
jgi:hypothetical protein